jgi:hypothetical protein
MATIPNRLYKIVDWHLCHENTLLADAQKEADEIRSRALATKGNAAADSIRAKGGHSDPTANTALELTRASDVLEKAKLWLSVIEETRIIFNGTPEGEILDLYFGKALSIADVCKQIHLERQMVYTYRDRIVTNCALLAVECGLIKARETTNP